MDPGEWSDLHLNVQADIRQLRANVRSQRQYGPLTAKQRRQHATKLSQLEKDLKDLESNLAEYQSRTATFKLGRGELGRRQGLVAQLQTDLRNAQGEVSGQSSKRVQGRSAKRKHKSYQDTEETEVYSNRDLVQQQQEALSQQDEALDAILGGVGTLKHMSEDINQELDLHTALLDDLDGAVGDTSNRIESNTGRVKDVEEQEASCLPLCIIFVLLVAIIALLFV